MMKKWLYAVIVCLLLVDLGMPASAAEGSIQVETKDKQVSLYQVGRAEGNGYRLTEACGGGYLTYDDTLSAELAVWLSGRVRQEDRMTPEPDGKVFLGLDEGLYLVCSEDADGFAPFLVIIPWDGYYWEVEVNPMDTPVPQTGDVIGEMIFIMAASGAAMTVLSRRRKKC